MIHCPACGELSSTTYSARVSPEGRKRYLRCKQCGHNWTTMEVYTEDYELLLKQNGLQDMKKEIADLKEERLEMKGDILKLKEENLDLRERLLAAKQTASTARTGVTWT